MSDALVDITITATRRPEILHRTLDSFYELMLRPVAARCRVFMNIDPVGDDVDRIDIINLVRAYFNTCVSRLPITPSFGAAFQWCWQQTAAPWILNLEEDWELLQPVDVLEMIRILEDEPDLALLRLPFRKSDAAFQKNWKAFFPWNGRYFECPADRRTEMGFCGHPSLIRIGFVKKCARFIDERQNPEKQFHHGHRALIETVQDYRYGVWGRPNDAPYVRDIGRQWMVEHGWVKQGVKAFFTKWERIQE